MAEQLSLYRNYTNSDSVFVNNEYSVFPDPSEFGWAKEGCIFKYWAIDNGDSNTLFHYNAGETVPPVMVTFTLYAIWEEVYTTTGNELKSVADAIRTKGGTSESLAYPSGFISAIENLPSGGGSPALQSKTVSPSTSQQTVTADTGYDGLSSVTVNEMPSGSATTPATTITANPTISVSTSGLITASVNKTQGVTPSVAAGYVASGTSGTITVNGSNTNQLTVYSGAHHGMISFIVHTSVSTSYQAQAGMTWGEWIESEYNTDGFYADNNFIYINATSAIMNAAPTYVIVANYVYEIAHTGGEN
jgi:hypothetical protein